MWGCILNNSYPRHCAVRRSYEKLYVGKKKKKKKAHHIHRWLPNPRQMSKGLTWQPEHLWKRAQRGEHDGFTDGCMCREMMKKPSQMSLYHFVFMDKTICVCVCVCVKVAADENAPIWVRMFLFARRIQNRHFCLFFFFFRWNLKTLNCVRKASQGDE